MVLRLQVIDFEGYYINTDDQLLENMMTSRWKIPVGGLGVDGSMS